MTSIELAQFILKARHLLIPAPMMSFWTVSVLHTTESKQKRAKRIRFRRIELNGRQQKRRVCLIVYVELLSCHKSTLLQRIVTRDVHGSATSLTWQQQLIKKSNVQMSFLKLRLCTRIWGRIGACGSTLYCADVQLYCTTAVLPQLVLLVVRKTSQLKETQLN
jgi:hypothetical protein